MSENQSLNYRHFFLKLNKYAQTQFTGRLNIKIDNTAYWGIYFNSGSIIWAKGGMHLVRRWLRQLEICGCEIAIPQGMTTKELLSSSHECWDYFALAIFTHDKQITPDQAQSIVQGTIIEILFDIVYSLAQLPSNNISQVQMFKKQEASPCRKDLLLRTATCSAEEAQKQTFQLWQKWVISGFTKYSPNLGIIVNQEELQAKKLYSLANYLSAIEKDEKTLRDLAIENEKPVLSIMRTLHRYLNQGLISFKEVPDLWQSVQKAQTEPLSWNQSQLNSKTSDYHTSHETLGEVSQFQSSSPRTLSTPLSGWRKHVGRQSQPEEEGIKINVMEKLIAEETNRQMKAYPPTITKDVRKLDVITFALNQVPPLYASSEEGIAYQTQIAKDTHQKDIKMAVQQAIATVRRNPFRNTTPIQSKEQNSH